MSHYLNRGHLTSKFINHIIQQGRVDTNKYRYIYSNFGYGYAIKRIKKIYLDTTLAIMGSCFSKWETVVWYEDYQKEEEIVPF